MKLLRRRRVCVCVYTHTHTNLILTRNKIPLITAMAKTTWAAAVQLRVFELI